MFNITKYFYTAITLSCIYLCACNFVTWEYLDVACNAAPDQSRFFEDYLHLNFSIRPDTQAAEKSIRLSSSSGIINHDARWEGNNLFIRPRSYWQKGAPYTFALTGSLRMDDGRYYTVDIDRSFHYGDENDSFYLVSGDLEDETLRFVFVKPPAIVSFYENFAISPQTETDIAFSPDGGTVSVKPKSGWNINTIYTWTIKNMLSRDDYIMERTYTGTFKGLFDVSLPELLEICPVTYEHDAALWHTNTPLDGQLLEKQAIGFIFSKPMEEASVKNGVVFTPDINGYMLKESDYKFIFVPEETYQLKKQYRVLASRTISDISGLKLFDDKSYFFTTINDYIKVNAIKYDDKSYSMPSDGTISDYTIAPTNELRVAIVFSSAIPAAHRSKAVSSVSLEILFPLSTANPALVSAAWSDNGSVLGMTWEGFEKSAGAIEQFYALNIKGGGNGVINDYAEYLKDDVCALFKALQ
jgi:WD40 repeat protein